jgi:Outer membrane protein beta-barrel domain
MDIKEKAYVTRPAAGVRVAATLLGLAGLGALMSASADEPRHTGWWFDAGIGGSYVSAPSDGVSSGGGGMWIQLMAGGRLNDHWLMGLDLGGSGLHPNSGNYNASAGPYCGCNSIWGETFDHTMLAVRYVPDIDHGWVYGLAAGPAFYNNKALETLTGNSTSGSGWALDGTVGYDWKFGEKKEHVETLLTFEQGRVSYNAPFSGQFSYSQVAASVHIAWF